MQAADEGAHRRSGDPDDLVPALAQLLITPMWAYPRAPPLPRARATRMAPFCALGAQWIGNPANSSRQRRARAGSIFSALTNCVRSQSIIIGTTAGALDIATAVPARYSFALAVGGTVGRHDDARPAGPGSAAATGCRSCPVRRRPEPAASSGRARPGLFGSPCWPSIHTLAAWQACPYWDSVASAGTSTLVVTPPGDTATESGGVCSAGSGASSVVAVGLRCLGRLGRRRPRPTNSSHSTARTIVVTTAVQTTTVLGYLRMDLQSMQRDSPISTEP